MSERVIATMFERVGDDWVKVAIHDITNYDFTALWIFYHTQLAQQRIVIPKRVQEPCNYCGGWQSHRYGCHEANG